MYVHVVPLYEVRAYKYVDYTALVCVRSDLSDLNLLSMASSSPHRGFQQQQQQQQQQCNSSADALMHASSVWMEGRRMVSSLTHLLSLAVSSSFSFFFFFCRWVFVGGVAV